MPVRRASVTPKVITWANSCAVARAVELTVTPRIDTTRSGQHQDPVRSHLVRSCLRYLARGSRGGGGVPTRAGIEMRIDRTAIAIALLEFSVSAEAGTLPFSTSGSRAAPSCQTKSVSVTEPIMVRRYRGPRGRVSGITVLVRPVHRNGLQLVVRHGTGGAQAPEREPSTSTPNRADRNCKRTWFFFASCSSVEAAARPSSARDSSERPASRPTSCARNSRTT